MCCIYSGRKNGEARKDAIVKKFLAHNNMWRRDEILRGGGGEVDVTAESSVEQKKNKIVNGDWATELNNNRLKRIEAHMH